MPPSPRILVCSCEDITLADIESCIERGYRDIESIKRYTGIGTGICQGRNCLHHATRLLVSRDESETEIEPFTTRPPLFPVALGMLARLDDVGGSCDQATDAGAEEIESEEKGQ